jgi:hypothetical protein
MTSFFFVGGADVMDRTHPPRTNPHLLAKKRSMTLDDKDHLLPAPSGATSTARQLPLSPPPQQSPDTTSPTKDTFPKPPSVPSMPSHSRSTSHADIVTQGKRLSLQFPIQISSASSSSGISPRSRPQSWVASPITPDTVPSPTETNFLAVIAAQERRVLELKEELAKAEADLRHLKKHLVSNETVRKRNDLRNVTKLQPVNTSLANYGDATDDPDGSSFWMQKEMERRKALLANMKTPQRKVFSGSRHMRTLSLLSPDKSYAPSFPQPDDIRSPKVESDSRPSVTRTSTSSDIATQVANAPNDERYDLAGLSSIQKDAILRTGKQMATDFKDGLLTFIEDIRQATVGDEALQGGENAENGAKSQAIKGDRKVSDGRPTLNSAASVAKKGANDQSEDIGSSFWKEHGLSEPTPAPAKQVSRPVKPARTPQKKKTTAANADDDDFEESWDNWDTPNDKSAMKLAKAPSSTSSDDSDDAGDGSTSTPVSGRSSARTSTSSAGPGPHETAASRDPKRNSIPWPDLVKLSPTHLKRTASHLMKEWEKNLTPPPEARGSAHTGDYIGRSVSPTPHVP